MWRSLVVASVFLFALTILGCEESGGETPQADANADVADVADDVGLDITPDGDDVDVADDSHGPDTTDAGELPPNPDDVTDGNDVPGGPEVCDNGADDDGDGDVDCDDSDCATHTACGPWCQAADGGHCYYVDAINGDDANDGSFDAPFATWLNLVTYYGTPGENGSTAKPSTWVDLQPGDAVYFMDGTYSETYNYQGMTRAFFVRGRYGAISRPYRLEAYPGQHPVFTPDAPAMALHLLQSSNWYVRGIEIDGARQSGVRVEETDSVVLREMHVHHTDGVDNDNIAGVYLAGASNLLLLDSSVHDNFDREAADTGGNPTENSSNIVAFGGGDIELRGNQVFNTAGVEDDKHGGCIKYKHMRTLTDGTFVVRYNQLEGCRFFSVGSGTPDTVVEGNVIVDSAPVSLRDFGGPTELARIAIRYNTFVGSTGLSLSPDTTVSDIDFSANIIVDNSESYGQEQGIITVGTYHSDTTFAEVTAPNVLTFDRNCYFNPQVPPLFDLFAGGADAGGVYTFPAWQDLGYDLGSYVEDPGLDAELRPSATHCVQVGHHQAP